MGEEKKPLPYGSFTPSTTIPRILLIAPAWLDDFLSGFSLLLLLPLAGYEFSLDASVQCAKKIKSPEGVFCGGGYEWRGKCLSTLLYTGTAHKNKEEKGPLGG